MYGFEIAGEYLVSIAERRPVRSGENAGSDFRPGKTHQLEPVEIRYATYYMGWNVWHGPGKHEWQKIELDPSKELCKFTVEAVANEVIVNILALTLRKGNL